MLKNVYLKTICLKNLFEIIKTFILDINVCNNSVRCFKHQLYDKKCVNDQNIKKYIYIIFLVTEYSLRKK